MTQEDKDLLLQDLCTRLPYGVKILVNNNINKLEGVHVLDMVAEYNNCLSCDISEIKPYLFPMSSMTEEQEKEFNQLLQLEIRAINDEVRYTEVIEFELNLYNKHHLDWRGLIKKGLAIDATGLNIY